MPDGDHFARTPLSTGSREMRKWRPIGHDHDPPPWFTRRRAADMRVPDNVIKCVAFIGVVEGGDFLPKATGFFVSYEFMQHRFMLLVTAEHVISGLIGAGRDLHARINLANGDVAVVPVPNDRWKFYRNEHPSDVAACPIDDHAVAADTAEHVPLDVLTVALNGNNAVACTGEVIARREIGVGDELFIVGLFRSHYGNERNRPIVRIGNIAAMTDEPVRTGVGYADAYLIEARSIGGLSGSPVFVHMPPIRASQSGEIRPEIGSRFYLLGLMHGHFDIPNLNEDSVLEDSRGAASSINTGIGIVIPVEKIIATVAQSDFESERRLRVADLLRQGGATPDLR